MATFLLTTFIICSLAASTRGTERVVHARVGHRVVLQPEGEPRPKYVTWIFYGKNVTTVAWWNYMKGQFLEQSWPWTQKLSLSEGALIINNIQEENFGRFECVMSSDSSKRTQSIRLRRLTVAQLPASPLLPGELLTLSCEVEDQRNIYWLNPREQRENPAGRRVTLTRKVTVQDSGLWTCVVDQQKSAQISVHVVELGPVLTHPIYTSTSAPVSIPCFISAPVTWTWVQTKGLQEVTWEYVPPSSSRNQAQRLFVLPGGDGASFTVVKDRGLRPVQNPVQGNFTLTRSEGREEDAGDYRCSMKFKNGTVLTRTVHVELLQIGAAPGTVLFVGQQLNLTCGLADPLSSDLQLRWSPPRQSSVRSVDAGHLTIPAVSREDAGKWSCELWRGQTRLTTATLALSVSEPSLKVNVQLPVYICSAAAVLIFIIIVALLFLRRRNRNTRRLRHQLCRCKQPKPKGFYRT